MQIGWVPNPREWERWPEAEALLEPAARLGDFKNVLEGNEILWAAIDGGELLAAVTAWLSVEKYVEVKLVGGRDRHRWLAQMDKVIGKAAREAGATSLRAWGRRGWARELGALGWASFPHDDKTNGYVRRL